MTVRTLVIPLRVVLALVALGVATLQLLGLPALAVEFATDEPGWDDAWAWLPFLLVVFAGLTCVQVILLCTWRLLTLVVRDEIFSEGARPWVDGIVRAMAAGWVLLAALAPYFYWFAQADDAPGVLVVGMALGLIATAVLLLMLVMRELLHRATNLRSDLEGVI